MEKKSTTYPLANPLAEFLNKPARDFNREDLLHLIEQKKIERVTFHYTALDGRLKELKIPVTNRDQAELILAEGERVDGSSLFKGILEAGVSDLYVVPEYKTAFLNPFEKHSLDFICRFLDKYGERAPFALDNVLHKAQTHFCRNTGLDLYALGELEFFLIYSGDPNIFPMKKQLGYHEAAPFRKSGEILDEMIHHISQISGVVKYSHSEVGFINSVQSDQDEICGKSAEQLEVEFLPKPADEMADFLVIARWIIRNVAFRHGCVATFAPKIELGVAGNGLHLHLQLRKQDKNIMTSPEGDLSQPALRLIGGLCQNAQSLTAFGNMVASSYLRLIPHYEAPTRIFWSDLNRNALIRVPLSWNVAHSLADRINPASSSPNNSPENRQTIEFRSPDGSALVHLLLAGIIMAADWAFADDGSLSLADKFYLEKEEMAKEDILDNLPVLPSSCGESAQILDSNRTFFERDGIFPANLIDYIVGILNEENIEVHSLSGSVDMRKLMHKYLHIS
ncbi:MAG: glutamine synthetase [Candidatus Aminicenantes bacterium]|nr:MAG: glutamine synthetase [Candidatus Aminicenantes bacterium]